MLSRPVDVLQQVRAHYDAGAYLQAYEAAQARGPLSTWHGPEARIMAARLAIVLGAPRLARVVIRLAYREHPTDWHVRYYYAFQLLQRKGPLQALEFLERGFPLHGVSDALQADWCGVTSTALALVRDFDRAQAMVEKAISLEPQNAWRYTERGFLRGAMDRRAEALADYDHALSLRPWYRPVVEAKGDVLLELGQDTQAVEFLQEACDHLESGHVMARLASLLEECGHYQESRRRYEQCRALWPLAEKAQRMWLDAVCADAAYFCSDFATAQSLAMKVDIPFFQTWAKRLGESSDADQRVVLPVKFIRQHHVTCAPATLAALCHFWDKPSDHLELAEKICYDGTPAHSQRQWLESRDLVVREFALNWQTAVALIDRGLPFTLETRTAISAHLQAVVGYDARRGSLLIRDPGARATTEFAADALFRELASEGPRAMVFVPLEKQSTLDEVVLPECELFDQYYRLQCALANHQRDTAQDAIDCAEKLSAGSRLGLVMRRTLCFYDGNIPGALAVTEQLLELFPKDSRLIHQRLECLSSLGRHAERFRELSRLVESKDGNAVYLREYGQELAKDARRHKDAVRCLQKVATRLGPDATTYSILGNIAWDRGDRQDALRLYRCAACIEDKWEGYARSYFTAARHLGRADEVLHHLQRRWEWYGRKAAGPAMTLHWALTELGRDVAALQALKQGIEMRPNDGALLTYAAEHYAALQLQDEADQWMAQAAQSVHRSAWLRASAQVARARGDLAGSLDAWQELAGLEPLNVEAHENVYDALRSTSGDAEALRYIRAVSDAHPQQMPIQRLLLHKLRGAEVDEAIAVARRTLTLYPDDGWTRRELALLLGKHSDIGDALQEARAAVAAEPADPASHACLAVILANTGQDDAARLSYQQALRISVDFEPAIDGLLGLCVLDSQRQETLRFVANECRRQTTFGDGPLLLIERAQEVIPADELLKFARDAHAARPDLWQMWVALIRQLRQCEQYDEALERGEEATERFPYTPVMWIELARLYGARKEPEKQVMAYRRTLELNPAWGQPAQELSEVYEQLQQPENARAVLEQNLQRAPEDVVTRVFLADLLWRQNQRAAGIEMLHKACCMAAGYDWAWNRLTEWLSEEGRVQELPEIARELSKLRPGSAYAWIRAADASEAVGDAVGALEAVHTALTLEPRSVDLHWRRTRLLADMGRLDEALAATKPAIWQEQPLRLRAWEGEIVGRQGRHDEAIRILTQVLEEYPEYAWAVYRLCDYAWQADRTALGLKWAQRFVELSPDAATAWGFLADFSRQEGLLEQAKTSYRKSVEIDPGYDFGWRNWLLLLLAQKEWGPAQELLSDAAKHLAGATLQVLQLRLELARDGIDADCKSLAELAVLQSDDESCYREAGALVKDSTVRQVALRHLRSHLKQAQVNPLLGITWAEATPGNWRSIWELLTMRPRGPAWHHAAARLAERQGEANHVSGLRWLARLAKRDLQSQTATWAAFGYAFASAGLFQTAYWWLRNGEKRQDAAPWVLCNLAYAALNLGRFRVTQQTAQEALARPADHSHSGHVTLLAATQFYHDAPAADIVKVLQATSVQMRHTTYQTLYDLTLTTALGMESVGNEARAYRQAVDNFQQVWAQHRAIIVNSVALQMLVCRCRERLATAHGRSPWWHRICRWSHGLVIRLV